MSLKRMHQGRRLLKRLEQPKAIISSTRRPQPITPKNKIIMAKLTQRKAIIKMEVQQMVISHIALTPTGKSICTKELVDSITRILR